MDPGYESDGEDAFNGSGDESEGFAIGTVVFPLDKQKDFVDTESVLINDADTYIGKYIGQFLSERIVGSIKGDGEDDIDDEVDGESGEDETPRGLFPKKWKVLGTMSEKTSSDVLNFLWAIMKSDDYDAYMKELLKCSVIIYDITHNHTRDRYNEIRNIVDVLREKAPTFRTKRTFILISTLHSWSHTLRSTDPDDDDAPLSEDDYRRRRTKPLYRELQLLERYVVASGKMTKGMVKAYVIGAGVVYGGAEDPLHHWFKGAWHNSKHLPIYGNGKNFMPTIYIKDLASIVQHVMDLTPRKQRYIIAVDPVIPQQDQIVKAISDVLGTGRIARTPMEDIYLNKQVTMFQSDQILLDLKIETTFCKENFQIDWAAENGFTSIIRKLASEYRRARNLLPLKIVIVGPPGSGKSTVARQISDMYRLHHFTKQELISSTRELLREIAGDSSEPDIAGLNTGLEEQARARAKDLLTEVDESEAENGVLTDDIIIKLYRYRLLSNPCQNQGFILDDFPENLEQAKALFKAGEDAGEYLDEDPGEDGRDDLDARLLPDRVFIFEAQDDFLKERLGTVPLVQLDDRHLEKAFARTLAAYRERMIDYDTSFQAYLDEQEIIYFPIDVAADNSHMMLNTVTFISGLMGKPRNYGISKEEEEALKNAQQFERVILDNQEKEDLAQLESRELEDRRRNIQHWMEKLAKVKREEFEREESALIPLRHYLMAHVVPTLTKGLIDVTRARPEDPIDFLAEYLFQNNPGGINPFGEHYMGNK